MSLIQKIRQRIIDREYYLSSHTEEEMREDKLTRKDIENALCNGKVVKKLTHDERGTRYKIEGPSLSGKRMSVICRFKDEGNFVIITVYANSEEQ